MLRLCPSGTGLARAAARSGKTWTSPQIFHHGISAPFHVQSVDESIMEQSYHSLTTRICRKALPRKARPLNSDTVPVRPRVHSVLKLSDYASVRLNLRFVQFGKRYGLTQPSQDQGRGQEGGPAHSLCRSNLVLIVLWASSFQILRSNPYILSEGVMPPSKRSSGGELVQNWFWWLCCCPLKWLRPDRTDLVRIQSCEHIVLSHGDAHQYPANLMKNTPRCKGFS